MARPVWLRTAGFAIGLLLASARACCGVQDLVRAEVAVAGLDRPAGLAVRPETGELFVAERGAGRIVQVDDGTVRTIVAGFGGDGGSENGSAEPLSIAFLDERHLLVGTGSPGVAADRLMLFALPMAGGPPADAERDHLFAGALEADGDLPACGNLAAIAVHDQAVFVAVRNKTREGGWIARADRHQNELSRFGRLAKTGSDEAGEWPGTLLLTPGRLLVAGVGGDPAGKETGNLKFFRREGDPLGVYRTELGEIAALAYSPWRSRLLALDSGTGDPQRAGLYKLSRLRGVTDHCRARRLEGLPLVRPVAMVFDLEGNLLIADEGAIAGEPSAGKGIIWRVSGLDGAPPAMEDDYCP